MSDHDRMIISRFHFKSSHHITQKSIFRGGRKYIPLNFADEIIRPNNLKKKGIFGYQPILERFFLLELKQKLKSFSAIFDHEDLVCR